MQRALTLYSTTIGKKVAMAISGAILVGFVVVHMLGNLQLYVGQEKFNAYAEKLHTDLFPLLVVARVVLLGAVAMHIASAFLLFRKNRMARPQRYQKKRDIATDYAAKTMYLSGPILLGFILYHLAHMTFGKTFGVYEWIDGDPYNNLVHGFQHWAIAIPYIVGNVFLGTHLFHGIYSVFQSLGANHKKYNHLRRDLAVGLATLVTLGNLSLPIAVQAGFIQPTDAAMLQLPVDGAVQPMIPPP